MGTFSIWHLLIFLLVVVLVFGTKKLGDAGGDIGRAIRSFKRGLNDDDDPADEPEARLQADSDVDASKQETADRKHQK